MLAMLVGLRLYGHARYYLVDKRLALYRDCSTYHQTSAEPPTGFGYFWPLLQETKARRKQNKLAKSAVIFIDINLARKPSIHRKIEHNQLPNRK
jgi:hypothetical protein